MVQHLARPMGATQAEAGQFGRKLRAELDRRNLGVRTLARTLAQRANAPDRTESIRRQLRRYLYEPVQPTAATRWEIEDALGLERDTLAADDEDEEADPAMRDAFLLFVDLMDLLTVRAAREKVS